MGRRLGICEKLSQLASAPMQQCTSFYRVYFFT